MNEFRDALSRALDAVEVGLLRAESFWLLVDVPQRERAAAELQPYPEIQEFLAFFDRSDRGSVV